MAGEIRKRKIKRSKKTTCKMLHRISLTLFANIIFLVVYSQDSKLITDRILYTVRLDSNTQKEGGFYQHLDSSIKKKLINQLCKLAYEGIVTAYTYYGDTIGALPYVPLRKEQAKRYFEDDSTVYNPKPERDNKIYRDLINSLSFFEEWYFDPESNRLSKKIYGIVLFQDTYTQNIGMRCNYYLSLNTRDSNSFNPENIIVRNIIYDVPITRTESEKKNDYNWWYNYLEPSKRERFLDKLTYKAIEDTVLPLKVYKPEYPYDSLMNRGKYSNVGLLELYYGRSNWNASDPLLSGMTDEKILACCFQLDDWTTVRKIRFHEEWYFDPNKLTFEKKVLGIGLIVDVYNEEGKVIGDKCLVYYKMND